MTPFGLLRVCSVAALAAGSVGGAMPAAADINKCNVSYGATGVVFTSCAAEERACEARGFIYGTTKHAQCVAALAGQRMPDALDFRPGRACEARGFIYGTTKHAQCVAALAGQRMPDALDFRSATPPAGMRQTPPPSLAPNPPPPGSRSCRGKDGHRRDILC